MDKLPIFKDAIGDIYALMRGDSRQALILAMGPMYRRPLIRFEEAYEEFIAKVVSDSALFDRWLNIQMQLSTQLGGDCEPSVDQFSAMIKMILDQTPGGESADFDKWLFDSKSFVFALAFRVYLDDLSFGQSVRSQ